jgi:hypothetical protein
MATQTKALGLADALEVDKWHISGVTAQSAADELRRLHALVAACEPYLKDGETPAERIERERGDTEAVCRLYAKEREKNVELLEALKDMVSRYGTHSARQEDKPTTFACRHMAETCSHCEDLVADWKAYQVARAAIAKATREQP